MSHFTHLSLPLVSGRSRLGVDGWLFGAVLGVVSLGGAEAAIAHGVVTTYQIKPQIQLRATYDSGEPFAQAQISVYPPNQDTPSQTGQTDQQGQFLFTPDSAQPGVWQVKVRAGGHGAVMNIPVAAATAAEPTEQAPQTLAATTGGGVYTPLQKGVMVGAIAWGCLGTALFCLRRKG